MQQFCDLVQIRTGPAGTIRVHMRRALTRCRTHRCASRHGKTLAWTCSPRPSRFSTPARFPYNLVELAGEADATSADALQTLLHAETRESLAC